MDAKYKNSYETLFVVDCDGSEETTRALIDKFTGMISENGEIEKIDEWGKRRLAYPINDKPEGYYVLVNFKSAPEFPSELERVYQITEGIMRYIVIHLDEKVIASRAAKAAATPAPVEEIVSSDDDSDETPAPKAEPVAEAAPAAEDAPADEEA